MACGCAERMRTYVLPATGYKLEGDEWVHPTHPPIPDADVEDHHTKLTAQIGMRAVRSFWAKLEG